MGQFAHGQRDKLLPFLCAICLSTLTVCSLSGNCFILEETGSRRSSSIVICVQAGVQDHAPSFPSGAGQRGCLIHCTCGPLEMPGPEPAHLPTAVTAHGQGIWDPLGPCPGEGIWLQARLLRPHTHGRELPSQRCLGRTVQQ